MDSTDFDIEIQEKNTDDAVGIQLPLNYLAFGEIEKDDVRVYIKQNVYKDLEKLASSDTSCELGSIILGEYCEEADRTHVVISDFIEAKYTDATASTLTFTHETWDYVHKEHESRCPEKRIVGWQHTHPNYGIFLSNYDVFIQENFFNMPFQIAYVIDPIQNLRGFFQWKNGKIEKLQGYYIYDDPDKPIKIEQQGVKKKDDAAGTKIHKGIYAVITALCIAALVLGVSVFSVVKKYDALLQNHQALLNEISNQKAEIEELKSDIEKENGGDSKIEFTLYTVVQGDCITKICEKNNIDYYKSRNIILSINGIENENNIYVGQQILLPVL